jgi:anti-sigma factor RsiW
VADGTLPNASQGDHELHDPEPIVALLDRDLTAEDRATAEAMIAACSGCAALFNDLQALAVAGARLPTARRPRDFTLTPEVAAALRGGAVREPIAVDARLDREMTETSPKHATHDRLLVASLADRTIEAAERARAEAQIAACDACARLHQDLRALVAATRELPVPSRPRDFTLSAADAERLRVRGWRRILGVFGSAGDVFSRPLAIGLTTLGLAGLLLGTVPGALSGLASGPASPLSAGAPAENRGAGGAGAEGTNEFLAASEAPPSAAAEMQTDTAAPAESAPAAAVPAPSDIPLVAGALESEDPLFEGGESNQLPGEPDVADNLYATSTATTGPSPVLIAGVGFLLAGVALFFLRWAGRRAGAG